MSKKSRINDTKVIKRAGPWKTKSDGDLSVLIGLSQDELATLFSYDTYELENIQKDIRGLRLYNVKNLPRDAKGANEWHKIRTEIVFIMQGSVEWQCEDLNYNVATTILDTNNGILVPSYILHRYKALEDDTSILVIANTLFDPDNKQTHDTYPSLDFNMLQNSTTIE